MCEYLLRVLHTLLASTPFLAPHNISEITERVKKRLPDPIISGSLNEANTNLDQFKQSKKNNNLVLPVEKIHQMLVKVGALCVLFGCLFNHLHNYLHQRTYNTTTFSTTSSTTTTTTTFSTTSSTTQTSTTFT